MAQPMKASGPKDLWMEKELLLGQMEHRNPAHGRMESCKNKCQKKII